ncbi:MAG TPA: PfkB family carbohydrate kinase [Jatrophihabitans sp.]|nr:PfkB family carbohydrate kinase [Jatrophihabitans sp.]
MVDSELLVVGSVNLDRRIEVDRLPAAGETVLATGSGQGGGGKGANQAAAAAALHDRVVLVGAVGDDEPARQLLHELAAAGVDVSAVRRVPHCATGTATVVVDATGANLILVEPGANARLTVADLPGPRLAAAGVVLLQLEVAAEVSLAAATLAGGRVIVNPAPAAPGAADLVRRADLVVPNEHELARLTGRPIDGEAAVIAAARALETAGDVLVTLGAQGALLYQRASDRVSRFAAPAVRVVDTTGAGDQLCGVLGALLAAGHDLPAACRRAVELASWSTTVAGARLPPAAGRG